MSSYVAIWPYVAMREGQIIEGGRPGFLNAIGTPEEYTVLDKYGISLKRTSKWEDFTVPQLKGFRTQLKNSLKNASADDKTVLNKYIFLLDQAIKAKGGGFFNSGFWDTLVGLSGVPNNPSAQQQLGGSQTSVQCADGSIVANPMLCPTAAPPQKNNLPLYIGITAGVLVVGGIVTALILKNRNQK
jgi:hypothetical protein